MPAAWTALIACAHQPENDVSVRAVGFILYSQPFAGFWPRMMGWTARSTALFTSGFFVIA